MTLVYIHVQTFVLLNSHVKNVFLAFIYEFNQVKPHQGVFIHVYVNSQYAGKNILE